MAGNSEEIASSRDGAPSALASAIREVKNNLADRDDVVIDMRDAQHSRLELLATELAPIFAEVPNDIEIFDFALSSGLQPRLWIDAVAHIAMGRDRRTYRFLRDTRLGRVVLAESTEIKPVADQVTRYIAERIVERQRMLDAGGQLHATPSQPETPADEPQAKAGHRSQRREAFRSALAFIAAGALTGMLLSLVLFWDHIRQIALRF
ncbi:hypothetical protein HNR59_002830 [Aquamicrobium lusatiense]|uniref:Uncharacterized protein n=1 Tax=Aquamicrobium lusatiense TaxID=89772 RepID=A0A7W9VW78_9HYPH|nr:hypothetical protein [Aquamicrobium lusatiense]MBB6013441.1 hypothetical protein [Aquamicrobium lusatiense]